MNYENIEYFLRNHVKLENLWFEAYWKDPDDKRSLQNKVRKTNRVQKQQSLMAPKATNMRKLFPNLVENSDVAVAKYMTKQQSLSKI